VPREVPAAGRASAMTGTETAVAPVTDGELVAFGFAMDEARTALAAALRRAETAETELHALAGRIGDVMRAAVEAERERAAAEIGRLRAELAERDRVDGLDGEWTTPANAARALGTAPATLTVLADRGILVTAPRSAGGHRRYLTSSVRALMAGQAGGLMSPAQAATALGVNAQALARLAAAGKVEFVRLPGSSRRYREPSVTALLREREAPGARA
jgi:hypothetical protein